MPSPSKLALVSGLIVSAGIFVGGAWLASSTASDSTAAISAPAAAGETAKAQVLSVTITGVRSDQGMVHVLVFDDARHYTEHDYMNAAGYAQFDAKRAGLIHHFEDLTQGPYAVITFHDENGNQDFDMADGIPLEGYGNSRRTDPYSDLTFTQAAVEAGAISVRMYYLQ